MPVSFRAVKGSGEHGTAVPGHVLGTSGTAQTDDGTESPPRLYKKSA